MRLLWMWMVWLLWTTPAVAACWLPQHQQIYTQKMFDHAIINSVKLNYFYVGSQHCNVACLLDWLQTHRVQFKLGQDTIAIFDGKSVTSIKLETSGESGFSGYLTCPSTHRDRYMHLPLALDRRRISMDFQAKDQQGRSRTIVLEKVSKAEKYHYERILLRQGASMEEFVDKRIYYLKNGGSVMMGALKNNSLMFIFVEKI